ncbi:MAG TPA: fluoride efflux transporter CrcB [Steroidobacteraceae bacterium]|jgi:CrcB protein|nr:fluoride efflux transporter CrcB [Steroidobacteraceae bacterium]
MPWIQFAAVGAGAACGAWLRWGFSLLLNPVFPTVPLGTLTANLVGGFIIGIVMGIAEPIQLSPTMRLLVVTGFLGGLTTFSTFSAETTNLLLRGQYGWGLVVIASHLVGSLALTGAGALLARAALAR